MDVTELFLQEELDMKSDVEISRRAGLDLDNLLPLTKEELAQFKPAHSLARIDIRKIRQQLGLSQAQFARCY